MPNSICLCHCVQGKIQVSQKFTDKPRIRLNFETCMVFSVLVLNDGPV